ncbi:MAG: MFS transporter [Rhodospirillaceae bacterium]
MIPTTGTLPEGANLIDGRYAWTRLVVSTMLGCVGSIGMWSVVVILPAVQAEFAVDRADASFPYTLTMLGFALGNVAIGRYTDRVGITIPIIAAALAIGTGFIGAAVSDTLWQFALLQGLLVGIGTAVTFGPLVADISHWFHRRRGVAVAIVACGNYIGGAVWPLVMQVFMKSDGWRATYVGIGVFCVLTMIPLALLLKRPPPRMDSVPPAPGSVGRAPVAAMPYSQRTLMIMLCVAGVACCVAMSMPQVHIVAYCTDLGYGMGAGADMLALMLAGGAVSRIAFGFVADRLGGVRTLLIGSVLQAIGLLFYLPFDGLMSLYAVSLMFGLAQGGIVPCYAIIVREYMPARVAGQRVGILIMATIFGMAGGGWISGWIYDVTLSYQAAFLHGIAWNLVNIAIMATLLRRTRTRDPTVMAAA